MGLSWRGGNSSSWWFILSGLLKLLDQSWDAHRHRPVHSGLAGQPPADLQSHVGQAVELLVVHGRQVLGPGLDLDPAGGAIGLASAHVTKFDLALLGRIQNPAPRAHASDLARGQKGDLAPAHQGLFPLSLDKPLSPIW
jgi:hypothetical protein